MRAAAAAGLLLTGCFYVDPIVSRPVVQIDVMPSVIYRGHDVILKASFMDPSAPSGTYDWKIFACTGFSVSGASGCDEVPFYPTGAPDETKDTVQFPVQTMTMSGAGLTQAIQVRLEARSDRGAVAEQTGQTAFPVGDSPPGLELGASARTFTVGAPIDLFARYSDPDNSLDDILLDWQPTPPVTPGAFTLEDLAPPPADPASPASRTAAKRLVPAEPGSWDIAVTTHYAPRITPDAPVTQHKSFTINPDQPPCLAQWQPIVPPAGTTLPITAPAVFQVPLVEDDLDAFPPVTAAPQFGTTTFAWSILRPDTTQRQILAGATGNRIDFDPGAFRPGDVVELRVEVFDRRHVAIPCDDSAATCSITASAACIQRQTWRVEVR